MSNKDRSSFFTRRLLASVAGSLLLLSVLGGCASRGTMHTGSIPSLNKPVESMNETELSGAAQKLGRAYDKSPKEAAIGMKYASVLRMTGKNDQALAVMEQVAIHNPTDRNVLAAYGKALAGAGQFDKALDAIQRSQTPDRPDWQLLSAEGAVRDQLGDTAGARDAYRQALGQKPNEPTVLSNLGMSYLLQGDLRTAETYMRTASQQPTADSRVRQNLALVVGLQGRFDEAEHIARGELSADQAQANVAYLRAMLSQQNAWSKLSSADKKAKATN